MHYIRPEIQTQKVCNESLRQINEADVFATTAAQNSVPDAFQPSIMCAREIGAQGILSMMCYLNLLGSIL